MSIGTRLTSPKPRILLADDDEPFRKGFCRLLKSEGYDCVCVADGAQAREMLKTSEFEALISDIFMPGNMDLEMIADIPQLAAGMPIILMTGRPTVETAIKSVNLSVTGYLLKPPNLNELHKILDNAIEAYRVCRRMAEQRRQFERWAFDLQQIEKTLRGPGSGGKMMPVARFLQIMTHSFVSYLEEMEQTLGLMQRMKHSGETCREQELTEVLRRVIDEIEQTRQSFKSKRLARLRTELQTFLNQSSSGH